MDTNNYITQLDALVKVIAPGIFIFTVTIILLEVFILVLKKFRKKFPAGLVLVVLGTIAVAFFHLDQAGIGHVGANRTPDSEGTRNWQPAKGR